VPAALQCPDCGHQEMLDTLGGTTTFRCGGCGRALKVPAQLRSAPNARGTTPGSPSPGAGEPTQALPKVPSGSSGPGPSPVVPSIAPTPMSAVAPVPTPVPVPVADGGDGRRPIAVAGDPTQAVRPTPAPIPPELLRPPLILRLLLWAIALPLGSLFVFSLASSLKVLTKAQLEDTFLLAGWGRFVPIARLLPFCALMTALIVQLGVFGLERLRARNLREGPWRRRPRRPGPSRPLAPGGSRQRATNGDRARDRVIS
jgi:hypothetical protein